MSDEKKDARLEKFAEIHAELTEKYLANPRLLAEAVAAIHASKQVVFAPLRRKEG